MMQELPQNEAVVGVGPHEISTAQESISAQMTPDSGDKGPLVIDAKDLRDPNKSLELVNAVHAETVQNQNNETIALYDEAGLANKEEVAQIVAQIEAEQKALIEKYGPEENWPKEAIAENKKNQIGWGFATIAGIGALAGMTTADGALAHDRGQNRYNEQTKFERGRVVTGAQAALVNIGVGALANAVGQATGQRVNPGGPVPIAGAPYYGGQEVYVQPQVVYRQQIPQGGYVQGYQGGGYENQERLQQERLQLEMQRNTLSAKLQNQELDARMKHERAMRTYGVYQTDPSNPDLINLYTAHYNDAKQAERQAERTAQQLQGIQARLGGGY